MMQNRKLKPYLSIIFLLFFTASPCDARFDNFFVSNRFSRNSSVTEKNCILSNGNLKKISQLQRIKREGENIYIASKMDAETDILYWFKKCMFNNLYTFYRVGIISDNRYLPIEDPNRIPTTTLNLSFSDNIGPFDIDGGGWCGGNHSYYNNQTKTAYNVDYRIFIDGKELKKDTLALVNKIEIKVVNNIMNPTLPTESNKNVILKDILCTEEADYIINRNNIQVSIRHLYKNKIPVTINKYYGMQSMFENENKILTVNGKYADWTPVTKVSRFIKKDYPYFRRFIEKDTVAYQSSYLLKDGLGNHSEISDTDLIFIGNSYGKCYHKLIANKLRTKGDSDYWSGIYTWFKRPVEDDKNILIYDGIINDKECLFINCKGSIKRNITLPPTYQNRRFTFIEKDPWCTLHVIKNKYLNISSPKTCSCIILFSKVQ